MHSIYFDSGTTNTRVYLLRDWQLVASARQCVGARNRSNDAADSPLEQAIRHLYRQLLDDHGLTDADIDHICMSGMATSPNGICTLNHLQLPVSRAQLGAAIATAHVNAISRDARFIPGAKTRMGHRPIDPASAIDVQMIRGEETEVFGILDSQPLDGPTLIILPGSHTQAVYVDGDGAISDLFSSITGEIRAALIAQTILGSSLSPAGPTSLDPEFVALGYRQNSRYGFDHALYGVRTMHMFSAASDAQRHSYLQGIITGSLIDGMFAWIAQRRHSPSNIIVAGRRSDYEAIRTIMPLTGSPSNVRYAECGDIPFSVRGYIALTRPTP